MKKSKIYLIWFFLLLIISLWYYSYNTLADEAVNVFAVVSWTWNVPIILQTIPSFDPIVIKRNSIQNFSLKIQDLDSASVTYTITSFSWSNFPINWTLTDAPNLLAGTAYLNFTYFSPNSKKTDETITITLNDGATWIVSKTLNLYVY